MAIIAGTQAEVVINHLQKIDFKKRSNAIEITLYMSNSMKLIAKNSFPKAKQRTGRSIFMNLLYKRYKKFALD